MITTLGTFLNTLIVPLNNMGGAMSMNLANYTAYPGNSYLLGANMSTIAFNIFAGPWIDQLGQMSIGLASFLQGTVKFLQGLVALL